MQTYLQNFVAEKPGALALGTLAFFGAVTVLNWTGSALSFINRHVFRRTYDIFERYGLKDSWVVVTGGSDGIGLEICEQMAEKGFNICIIARNESKINEKLSILEKKHNVKTRCIVFDFAELCFISDYKKRIALKLKDIDIAMLFLNAGFAQGGAFAEQTDQDI